MSAVPAETVLAQLKWRYATKKFDPTRTIPADVWAVLEQALVLTPSSYGLQPWKFFVVTDPTVKAELPAHSWGQSQPKDCSHMVVLTIRKGLAEADVDRYISRISEVREQKIEALGGFKKMMLGTLSNGMNVDEWAARQVYIALGQFMAAAAVLGVDTCPMEGIDPAKYDEVLGIGARGYHTIVACPAGYRSSADKSATAPKVRFKTEDVIQVI
jgi:nitroreductase